MENVPVRYKPVSNYEQAPYATVVKVINNYDTGPSEDASYYIQISKTEEKPNWIPVGEFLETAYKSKFTESAFLNNALRLFDKETK